MPTLGSLSKTSSSLCFRNARIDFTTVTLKDPKELPPIDPTLLPTMTWTAFFQAFRRGISDKASALTRRVQQPARNNASQTTTTRSASSQASAAPQPKEQTPPMEQWDYYLIDVSVGPCWSDVWQMILQLNSVFSSFVSDHAPTLIRQEFGEPWALPPTWI